MPAHQIELFVFAGLVKSGRADSNNVAEIPAFAGMTKDKAHMSYQPGGSNLNYTIIKNGDNFFENSQSLSVIFLN